jgi:hypothetical protein
MARRLEGSSLQYNNYRGRGGFIIAEVEKIRMKMMKILIITNIIIIIITCIYNILTLNFLLTTA